MPPFRLVKRVDGSLREIHNFGEWKALAHLVEGKSAHELAIAWNDPPHVPAEVAAVLAAKPLCAIGIEAEIERASRFDAIPRRRYHDLLLSCSSPTGPVIVGIEGKVSEPFGRTIAQERAVVRSDNTRFPDRLDALILALFGRPRAACDDTLRYQLLTAIAGTLAEAGAANAVAAAVIIQEFHTFLSTEGFEKRSSEAIAAVLGEISTTLPDKFEPDVLVGPVYVAGNAYIPSKIPCYLAKVSSQGTTQASA